MEYKKTCKNCENWDLYCKLGKKEYYWCRIYNWLRFELKKELIYKEWSKEWDKKMRKGYINKTTGEK